MRYNLGLILPALFIMAACGQQHGNTNGGSDTYLQSDSNFLPAGPGGNVQVMIGGLGQDEQQVTIKADIAGQHNEKTFSVAVSNSMDSALLYKFVWDTATSCYVAIMKKNMQPRYYHASIQDRILKIQQVGTPPMRISDYADRLYGADSIGRKMVKNLRRRVQSGNLLEDLVVDTRQSAPDLVVLNVAYGSVSKTDTVLVPHALNAGVLSSDKPDEVDYGVLQDGRFVPLYNIKVNAGELRLKQLNKFNGSSATAKTERVQSK